MGDPLELGERFGRLHEARVVLEQDPAQLPGQLQRLDRRPEGGKRRVVRLALVARHRLVRLHVEGELGRCPLRPVPRHPGIGEVVVGRVDLDRVEALGVVPQPCLRRRDAARVPRLDEALVREGAGAEADGRGHGGKRTGTIEPPRARVRGYLLRTTLLLTENPLTVGLTHGVVPVTRVQSDGAAALVALASARKNVPTANFAVNLPLAETRTRLRVVSLDFTEPPRTVTVAPERGSPACVTEPVTTAPLPDVFAESVTAPGSIAAGATTARALSGVTWPGLYGTQEEIQGTGTHLAEDAVDRELGAVHLRALGGSSWRTEGHVRGRQADHDEGRAELRLWLGRRYIGTLSVCPSAEPVSNHVAIGTLDPMQACLPGVT